MVDSIFKMMGPYTKRVAANGFAIKVVTRVLDYETDVVVPCEVYSELDVPNACGFDDVDRVTSLCASRVWI